VKPQSRNLDIKSLTEIKNSCGYDDSQSNISKSNSTSASEDDIDELENPEANSADPECTYFGEITLTDLNSVPGFRKDLHYLIKNIVHYMLLNQIYVNTPNFFRKGRS